MEKDFIVAQIPPITGRHHKLRTYLTNNYVHCGRLKSDVPIEEKIEGSARVCVVQKKSQTRETRAIHTH